MTNDTDTSPYPRFGENPNVVSEPIPVPGYPTTDAVPAATGNNTVVKSAPDAAEMMAELARQNQELVARVFEQAEQNRALMEQIQRQSKNDAVPTVSGPQGGPPILHHLHLVDGRVISNHDGIGTHYSETLPDGNTRVTKVAAYYPAETIDPVSLFA